MTAKQIIDMGLAKRGISKGELARQLGWSRQLLSTRMNTGKFSVEEWESIANAIGAEIQIAFLFDDGIKVGLVK